MSKQVPAVDGLFTMHGSLVLRLEPICTHECPMQSYETNSTHSSKLPYTGTKLKGGGTGHSFAMTEKI